MNEKMNVNYYESSLAKENKIEYVDTVYLSKYALSNRENAMNYFYTSPFYTNRSADSLNEKIRTGKPISDDDEGYLFKITYENLKVLKKEEPSDPIGAHIYYNTNAIFHISMTHIYKVYDNTCKRVIQFFCIFNGKIYSCISFGELLTSKINHIVKNIEKCFDSINEMMNFDITSNYYFENKKTKELDPMYQSYKLDGLSISGMKPQKKTSQDKIKDKQTDSARIFYTRNVYDYVSRMADEELIYKSTIANKDKHYS